MIQVNGERFVVTGGAGFIGSHIVEELVRQKKLVLLYDDYSNAVMPYDKTIYGETHLVKIRPWDIQHLCDDEFNGYTIVFHEACSKCTVCQKDPLRDLMTNAWGSFRVFQAAQEAGAKVVHASTGSVYGDNRTPAMGCGSHVEDMQDEQTQYAPKSFYGVSKLAGEQYLRAFKEYYGLRFVGLRYFHVFGPRQDSGPNGGVVAIFITKMLRGEPITVFGDGEQVRSFTYVKDVVKANFLAANSKEMEGDYFNVASGVRISLNQLIESLSEIIGRKPKVEYVGAKKGDIRDFNVSNDKIAQYGMNEWTAFDDGLRETVDWYGANHANS